MIYQLLSHHHDVILVNLNLGKPSDAPVLELMLHSVVGIFLTAFVATGGLEGQCIPDNGLRPGLVGCLPSPTVMNDW